MDIAEQLVSEASAIVSRSRRFHATLAQNHITLDLGATQAHNDDEDRLCKIETELATVLDSIGDEVSRVEGGQALFLKGKFAWLLHSSTAAIASPSPIQKQQQKEYSAAAEDALTKSVKLCPSSIEAWNLLGDLLGERGEFTTARDCFSRSIAQAPNKKALRDMAMVMRKLGETPKEKAGLTMSSLKSAKQAVALDVEDSESWYVLGMSYLAIFFALSHKLADLSCALKAFKRAVLLVSANSAPGEDTANPDLYFNRGQVYSFLEDYPSALQDFRTAELLDPTLPVSDRIEALHRRVVRAAEMVSRRGLFKAKRLATIAKSFRSPNQASNTRGVNKSTPGTETIRRVSLSELKEGSNEGVSLDIKLLMPLTSSELPVSLLVIDREMAVFVLSVYHLDQSALDKVCVDVSLYIYVPMCL
jgi:tetratricopeptide (TPR) repeat protein